MCVFPQVVTGEETLKYVFPTKQKDVQTAIDLAKSDIRIERLIVFGSSVTLNCGMTSDIDMAIDAPGVSFEEFPELAHDFYRMIESEVDLIQYNQIRNALLKDEIDRKGVTVYAKCP